MGIRPSVRPYIIRLAILLAISALGALAFNEAVYRLQKERYDRAPQTFSLVIPAGTAQRVEAGQDNPVLPSEMVFVVGDVLEVKNEDDAPHQLGPIWVPPGTTGKLVMKRAESLAYECSFQTSRYFGLDVRKPTTIRTRLTGILVAAPTVATLLFLYSLLVFPVRPAAKTQAEQRT